MIFALPRIDFSKGIPPEFRTLTVVPTMLISPENIDHLIEALEVRFLANREENLHFGLLTDFLDAREETIPEDEPLLRLAGTPLRRHLRSRVSPMRRSSVWMRLGARPGECWSHTNEEIQENQGHFPYF